jgi:hypothetical protein
MRGRAGGGPQSRSERRGDKEILPLPGHELRPHGRRARSLSLYRPSSPGLKWILKKWNGRMWTGFFWLPVGSNGGFLWTRQWTFGFHEVLGIYSPTKRSSGYQEEIWRTALAARLLRACARCSISTVRIGKHVLCRQNPLVQGSIDIPYARWGNWNRAKPGRRYNLLAAACPGNSGICTLSWGTHSSE